MCRWLAYSGSPIRLEELLLNRDRSLIDQSLHSRLGATTTNGDGFGVGWYDDSDTPRLYRSVHPAWNDRNLRELAAGISSHLFLSHIRASTGTAIQETNTHPFRYGRWLWVHNGLIREFPRMRRELVLAIDDSLFTSIEGTTDSETMFYLALTFGLESDPVAAVERMVGFVEETGRKHGVEHPLQMTIGTTDGQSVYAFRYSSEGESRSLYFSTRMDALKALYPENEALAGLSDETRVVVSEPLGDLEGAWNEVPESHVGIIQPGADELRPFAPHRPMSEAPGRHAGEPRPLPSRPPATRGGDPPARDLGRRAPLLLPGVTPRAAAAGRLVRRARAGLRAPARPGRDPRGGPAPGAELDAADAGGAAQPRPGRDPRREGEGRVLDGDGSSFHDATVRPATSDEVRDHLERDRASASPARDRGAAARARCAVLPRRRWFRAPHVSVRPVGLRQDVLARRRARAAAARDRPADSSCSIRTPTSCGSGSCGRTRTTLDAARYAEATRSLAVKRAGDGLALLLAELDPALQAAALRLDPVADREEYTELVALTEGGEALSLERLEQLEREGEAGRRLIGRARNLGLHRWGIWAGSERALAPAGARTGRRPLPRGRPRLTGDEGGAGAGLRGRARRAVAATRGAQAGPDRRRRGAQRLPGAARRIR